MIVKSSGVSNQFLTTYESAMHVKTIFRQTFLSLYLSLQTLFRLSRATDGRWKQQFVEEKKEFQ